MPLRMCHSYALPMGLPSRLRERDADRYEMRAVTDACKRGRKARYLSRDQLMRQEVAFIEAYLLCSPNGRLPADSAATIFHLAKPRRMTGMTVAPVSA